MFFSPSVTQVSVVQSSSSSVHPSAHSSQSSNKLPIRSGHTHHSGDAQNLRAAQVRRPQANFSTHDHILVSSCSYCVEQCNNKYQQKCTAHDCHHVVMNKPASTSEAEKEFHCNLCSLSLWGGFPPQGQSVIRSAASASIPQMMMSQRVVAPSPGQLQGHRVPSKPSSMRTSTASINSTVNYQQVLCACV